MAEQLSPNSEQKELNEGTDEKPSLHKHTFTIAIRETNQTAQHSLEITTRRLVSSGASLLRNMGFNNQSVLSCLLF